MRENHLDSLALCSQLPPEPLTGDAQAGSECGTWSAGGSSRTHEEAGRTRGEAGRTGKKWEGQRRTRPERQLATTGHMETCDFATNPGREPLDLKQRCTGCKVKGVQGNGRRRMFLVGIFWQVLWRRRHQRARCCLLALPPSPSQQLSDGCTAPVPAK